MAAKKNINTHWIISANDLLLGDVVYLTWDNQWTRQLQMAVVTASEEIALVQLAENSNPHSAQVVSAEAIPVTRTPGGELVLNTLRDQLRESGPSHRHDLSRVAAAGVQHV